MMIFEMSKVESENAERVEEMRKIVKEEPNNYCNLLEIFAETFKLINSINTPHEAQET